MSCGNPIPWYDNIPVVSWLYLRGRCRICGSAISIQYPLVELSTGALYALIGASAYTPLDLHGIYRALALVPPCMIAAILVAIAVYDIRHTIIPDAWVYTFAFVAFVWGFLVSVAWSSHYGALLFVASGPLAALPLFALWAVSGGRWMGLGDVKLALGMGWLLGPWSGLFAVLFAFILGAAVSLPLLVLSSKPWRSIAGRFTPTLASPKSTMGFTMGSEIPFGPFLVASCIIIWLTLINGIELVRIFVLLPH